MSSDPKFKFYVGGAWRPEFSDTNFEAEPPTSGKDPSNLVLSLSDSDINDGDSITLTATLKSVGTGLASKSIIFEEKVGTAAWATVDTETTNGSGVATTSPSITPGTSRSYRARFVTDVSYVGSTSSTKTLTVRTLQEVVKRFYATWSNTYNPDFTQNSETDVRQNMYTTSGINKAMALVGFDDAAIADFLADRVDNVSLKVSFKSTVDGFFTGTALIGFHDYTSKPATWSDARVDQNQFLVETYGIGRYNFTTDVDSFIDDFASGANRGISFGPSTTTSTNYVVYIKGNVSGGDDSSEPWIEFTVTKWLAT